MSSEHAQSPQSSSSANNQDDIGTNTRVIESMAQRASEDKFHDCLKNSLAKANDWYSDAEGDLIHIKLTEVQEAEINAVIWTLERVKMLYEEMNDGE